MAIQPVASPQLSQDPYAVSRGGFGEVLSYFKEQRALRQNAKAMAEQAKQQQKSMQFEYDLRLRNDMVIQGMKNQESEELKEQKLAVQALEMFKDATQQANTLAKETRGRLDDFKNIFSYNLTPNFVVEGIVDPESFTPGIRAYATIQSIDEGGNPVMQNLEYNASELESVIGRLRNMKPVADMLDSFYDPKIPKPEKTEEIGGFILMGNDVRGREIASLLRSPDPSKENNAEFKYLRDLAMNGKIVFNESDLSREKTDQAFVDARIKAETELGKIMKLLEAENGMVTLQGNFGWLIGRGAKIDFNEPIEKVIQTLYDSKDTPGRIDGLSDANIEQIRALHSNLLDLTRIYRQQQNPTRPEMVDMSNVYFDYKNNTLTRREQQSGGSAPPTQEANILTGLNNTN
jgi:hypothetical protein